MNKSVRALHNQVINSLERLQNEKKLYYYCLPCIQENNNYVRISWNNHRSDARLSEKYFLRVEQYCEILRDQAYWAILKDFSLIRGSFEFEDNKLLRESLLWWPCPAILDLDMVEEFGLLETVEAMFGGKVDLSAIRMRTPMRIDFDVKNDSANHPMAHIHMQNAETRINSREPICFNRFLSYVIVNFYPDWEMSFDVLDYIPLNYEKQRDSIEYDRSLTICY